MTTITYGFFIYIFLTTIYEIYAADPTSVVSNINSKCNLSDVIRASDYAKKCSKITYDDKVLLPEFELDQISLYLCTGIFETANKMCEMNVNITSMNVTTLDKEILKSQPSTKGLTLTKFCSHLNNVISSEPYKRTINYTAHPNIVKLNKELNKSCEQRLCWIGENQTIANSLCSILLWENKIIAKIEILTQRAKNESKPDKLSPSTESKAPKPQLDTTSGGDGTPKAQGETHQNTEAQTHEESIKSSSHELKTLKKTVKADSTSPIVDETSEQKVDDKGNKQITSSGSGNTDQHSTISEKLENNAGNQEEHETHEGNESQLGSTAEGGKIAENPIEDIGTEDKDNAKLGIESGGNNDMKSQLEADAEAGKNEENPVNDIGTGNEDDIKPGIELDDDNDPKNDDGDDNGAQGLENPGLMDSASTKGGKTPNSSDQTSLGASSNGKGVADSNTQGKVLNNNQENRGPKDHGSQYPGPPDPPQHFFAYFMAISFICLVCYVGYHKKHKIMGIIFEGRKSRGGRARRRPNTAGYRKLDCNLEEAVTSQCNSNATHVIY